MNTLRRHLLIRIPIVAALLVACLALANHCAMGGMQPTKPQAAHACCDAPPVHQEKAPTATACCKAFQIVPLTAKAAVPQASLTGLDVMVAGAVAEAVKAAPRKEQLVFDHGPPRVISFAEEVLQRSLLSHAPPVG